MVRDPGVTAGTLTAIAATFDQELSAPMVEWCRRLATPDLCEWVKDKRTSETVVVRGVWADTNVGHELDAQMLAAGLIQYQQRVLGSCPLDETIEYVAVLTDAGRCVGHVEQIDQPTAAVDLFGKTP